MIAIFLATAIAISIPDQESNELRVPISWADTPFVEPSQAFLDQGGEGVVHLACDVTTEGQASSCVVIDESPSGLGLGDAALAARPNFKFNPAKIGGVPVADRITFAIAFRASVPEPLREGARRATPEMERAFAPTDFYGFTAGSCAAYLTQDERDRLQAGLVQFNENQKALPVFDQVLFGAYGRGLKDSHLSNRTEDYCVAALSSATARLEDAADVIAAVEASFPPAGRRR